MADCVVVLVTCPTPRSARQLADILIRGRFAACVNIVPRVHSVFRWKGRVERAGESLLIVKTTAKRFPSLRRAVRAHHPHDVPEVIALPITYGHAPYLAWVRESAA